MNNKIPIHVLPLLLVSLWLWTAAQAQDQQKPQKKLTMPLRDYEATLRPSDFDNEPVINQYHSVEQIPIPEAAAKDSLVIQEEVVQGFRIQLFSSSNIDEATLVKTDAAPRFKADSIYVIFDAPVYKVRAGDFLNRYEANQRLPEFVAQGYQDAWIVPDRVVQRKVVYLAPASH